MLKKFYLKTLLFCNPYAVAPKAMLEGLLHLLKEKRFLKRTF